MHGLVRKQLVKISGYYFSVGHYSCVITGVCLFLFLLLPGGGESGSTVKAKGNTTHTHAYANKRTHTYMVMQDGV